MCLDVSRYRGVHASPGGARRRTCAGREQGKALVLALQAVAGGGDQARASGAEGVADGQGPPEDVGLGHVHLAAGVGQGGSALGEA